MSTALDRDKFSPGDRVLVASPHAFAGLEVTVERYWRNGYFIVREDRFQTTCAADADKLTAVEPRPVVIADTVSASAAAIARIEEVMRLR